MENVCNICEKNYKSYKSLWNHNKKYHKKTVVKSGLGKSGNCVVNGGNFKEVNDKDVAGRTCKICKKVLCDRSYRWKHQKKCNKEIIIEDEIDKIKKESAIEIEQVIKKSEMEIEKVKTENEILKNMLKSIKIHPKTFNKINNQLINNNINNINNGNITNNNIYVQLGRENLSEILTEKEKKKILNRQSMGLNDLVDLVHISGKYKQFRNVYITNLQNNIGYKYDDKKCKFIPVSKNELLTDLVDARMYDIENFFEEFGPSLEPQKYDNIKKFIERMNDEEDVLKGIKKNEIKLVIYNPNNPNNSIEI